MTGTPASEVIVLREIHRGRQAAETLGYSNAIQAFDEIEHLTMRISEEGEHKDILSRAISFLDQSDHQDDCHLGQESSHADLRAGVEMAYAVDRMIAEDLDDSLFHSIDSSDSLWDLGNQFRASLNHMYHGDVAHLLNPSISEDIADVEEPGFPDYPWHLQSQRLSPA